MNIGTDCSGITIGKDGTTTRVNSSLTISGVVFMPKSGITITYSENEPTLSSSFGALQLGSIKAASIQSGANGRDLNIGYSNEGIGTGNINIGNNTLNTGQITYLNSSLTIITGTLRTPNIAINANNIFQFTEINHYLTSSNTPFNSLWYAHFNDNINRNIYLDVTSFYKCDTFTIANQGTGALFVASLIASNGTNRIFGPVGGRGGSYSISIASGNAFSFRFCVFSGQSSGIASGTSGFFCYQL